MSTLVNGNTGTVFSDLRSQAHTYVAPEYDEDRINPARRNWPGRGERLAAPPPQPSQGGV